MTHPSIKRRNRLTPWGYTQDPDDPLLLNPIEDLQDAYDQAKEYIKAGCSYRDTAKWLSATTETHITHVGLFQKIKQEKHKARCEKRKLDDFKKYYPELIRDDA